MSPAVIVNGSGSYAGFPCTDAPSGMVREAPAASAPPPPPSVVFSPRFQL